MPGRTFDVAGASDWHRMLKWAEDRMTEAVLGAGAARVRISVEPLETPEMGDEVGTPDGPGRVAFPTTEVDAIAVDLTGPGLAKRKHYDLDELEGFSRSGRPDLVPPAWGDA